IIESKLEKENIFIINEQEVSKEQENFIKDFFIQKVSPELVTIVLNSLAEFPQLKDTSGYLAVKLVMNPTAVTDDFGVTVAQREIRYAVIELPKAINRFVVLPSIGGKQYIMLIDDVIRYNLH